LPNGSIWIVASWMNFLFSIAKHESEGLPSVTEKVLCLQKAKLLLERGPTQGPLSPRSGSAILIESGTDVYTRDELVQHGHNKQFKSHTT
jgi:hypothetical protein